MAILDSSMPFNQNKIDKLPCSYFLAKPTGSYLKMLLVNYGSPTTPKDTIITPIRQFTKQINNIHIDIVEYNDTYGSATTSTGLMEYTFDSVKETEDSLTFYNVNKTRGGKVFQSTTSFPKGNIKIFDSPGKEIDFIEIEQIIVQRGDIYKPTEPFKLVPNQPIVGFANYRFYPTNKISSNSLTDYGIFKRLK